jgi:ABC-type phosphate transport system substrate-binding protein
MLAPLVLVAAILLSPGGGQPLSGDFSFRVVVNKANPVSSLTRAELSAIFMRRVRSWPDGTEIRPVDHRVEARVRERFSRAVHGKSVAYVIRYWQRLVFAGRGLPPPEVRSAAAVLRLVSAHRGAIGYVDDGTPIAGELKVIEVTK